MAGAPEERKIETVGKDKVRVEFTIDELVNRAIFNPIFDDNSCKGCNKCMAADFGSSVEEGGRNG